MNLSDIIFFRTFQMITNYMTKLISEDFIEMLMKNKSQSHNNHKNKHKNIHNAVLMRNFT